MKRILIALMASMMVVTTAACGNSGSTSSSASESSSASSSEVASTDESSSEESAPESSEAESSEDAAAASTADAASIPVPADATDEEKAYIEQLNKALPAIADVQTSQAEAMTDPEAAKKVLEDMKVKFDELGALQAPAKYADAQAKFAEGSKAMNEYIDYMIELSGMTAEEATPEKQTEVMNKVTELTTTAMTAFSEAYGMFAGDGVAAAADAPVEGESSAAEGESSSAAE